MLEVTRIAELRGPLKIRNAVTRVKSYKVRLPNEHAFHGNRCTRAVATELLGLQETFRTGTNALDRLLVENIERKA